VRERQKLLSKKEENNPAAASFCISSYSYIAAWNSKTYTI
jgi:hypothetical protein